MIHGEVDPRRLLWMHQSCMIDVSKETAAKPLDQDRSDESLHLSISFLKAFFHRATVSTSLTDKFSC